MNLVRRGLVALLLIASISHSYADSDPPPYEAIRTLQRLQDRIATGDAIAQAAHVKALQRTARSFASAKLSMWSDKRNARALILFLFSGGGAAAIDAAIPRSALVPAYEALYTGALAYGLGNDEKARETLMPINARTLPSGLGGHLALVQATLAAPIDQPKAIALLDLARLLEPGTLIEEAALRKEMSLIGATGDLDKFALLARRYLGNFSRSIYADNFIQLVARTAMQLGAGDNIEATAKLGILMNGVSKVEKRRLYLMIAREAVIAGRTVMALAASEEAGRLAEKSDTNEARALVYFGAAAVVGSRYDAGLKALRKAAPERLEANDRVLLVSALSVAALIRRPMSANGSKGTRTDMRGSIAADAQHALAAADDTLKDASH